MQMRTSQDNLPGKLYHSSHTFTLQLYPYPLPLHLAADHRQRQKTIFDSPNHCKEAHSQEVLQQAGQSRDNHCQ